MTYKIKQALGQILSESIKNFEGKFQSSLSLLFDADLKEIPLKDSLEFQRLLEINMLGQSPRNRFFFYLCP